MNTPPPGPQAEREPAQWQRLQQLFHAALALDAAARADWVDARCADDPALRKELLALLAAAALADAPISQAIGSAAAQWAAAGAPAGR